MLKPQSPGEDDDDDDDGDDDGGDYDDCDVVNTDFTVVFRDIATLSHVYWPYQTLKRVFRLYTISHSWRLLYDDNQQL